MDWKPFGSQALSGLFWARVVRSVMAGDQDRQGVPTGGPTEQSEAHVALVQINFDPSPGGVMDITPIDPDATGAWYDEDVPTHVAAFELPRPTLGPEANLARDAARYRWLRGPGMAHINFHFLTPDTSDIGLDHAIDYAIANPD